MNNWIITCFYSNPFIGYLGLILFISPNYDNGIIHDKILIRHFFEWYIKVIL